MWTVAGKQTDISNWRKLLQIRDEVSSRLTSGTCVDLALLSRQERMELVYELLHPSVNEVAWNNLVWSSYHVPKTSFIAWLACCGRLQTKDALSKYIPGIDNRCGLCNEHVETLEHLFFQCSYSTTVVNYIMLKVGLDVLCTSLQGWIHIFAGARHQNRIIYKLRTTALCCCIYAIWESRNRKQHAQMNVTHE